MNKSELKVKALLERVSSLTTEYENKVADLRVALTVSQDEHKAEIDRLSNKIVELTEALGLNDGDSDVVAGEVEDVSEKEA